MGRGKFIVLEGIDGSGKSTQARRLAGNLKAKGFSVVLTREPADSPAGERLRKLAREGRKGVSKEEETRLFQEDRAWHCRNVIEPGLARGDTVVSDRYWYSTVAYQGALGADPLAIAKESREKFPAPDFVVYLRVTPKEALRRILASRP
ncbi:MAG: dTMP kinase, partial [Bdellovibrionota bacterium]